MLMPVKPVRPQTLTLKSYLDKFKEGDVKGDADTQRAMGCYTDRMFNELVVSVLIGEYIPPLILGETSNYSESYVEDGLQRTTALSMFRYGNKAVSKDITDSEIAYQVKVKDKNGNYKLDGNDNFIKEWEVCDIKNKTYSQLPEELKMKFDEYQIGLAVHPDSTKEDISRRIRIYNEHENMKAAQRALTYIPTYAKNIKKIISNNRFYKDCIEYSDKEFTNGLYEKILCETDMIIYHLDEWQSVVKTMGMYIEDNASEEEFEKINALATRLYNILGDDKYKNLFSKKNTYLWTALFEKFTKYNFEDCMFINFLKEFNEILGDKRIDGYDISVNEYDKKKRTKDKKVVKTKLDMLEKLMKEYLHITDVTEDKNEATYNKGETHSEVSENTTETENNIESSDNKVTNDNKSEQKTGCDDEILSFVKENISSELTTEDVELYANCVDDCFDKYEISITSPLYKNCYVALIALMTYAANKDKDKEFEEWIQNYKDRTNFSPSQKINYTYMKRSFDDYLANRVKEEIVNA